MSIEKIRKPKYKQYWEAKIEDKKEENGNREKQEPNDTNPKDQKAKDRKAKDRKANDRKANDRTPDYRQQACEEIFVCKNCGRTVIPEGAGSRHRNHCPNCLFSLHVDLEPGDRAADCGGHMEPISVWVRKSGEWAIIHRCRRCGALSSNRVAGDDNPVKLMSIALKPLAAPPFPVEKIEEMADITGMDNSWKEK